MAQQLVGIYRALVVPACLCLLSLGGCGSVMEIASNGPYVTTPNATSISGETHGGFNPISGSVVTLYLSGTAGYGTGYDATTAPAGAKAVAHTTTDSSGAFAFTTSPTSVANDNSSSTYSCPSTGDPLVYLVSRGGNTTGAGSSINNSAAVLMTIAGVCSGTSPHLTINEVSTVGTVFSLQQFMSLTSTDVFIGVPNTMSAATGLHNAVATVQNLINLNFGTALTTVSLPGLSTYNPSTFKFESLVVTGTPEYQKLVTMGNILANCVNQTSASSTQCTSLLGNAVSPKYQTTNQPIGTASSAASDTLMAAYYVAINPTQAQDGVSTRNTTLYGLTSGYAPFGAGLSQAPLDWTVAITYQSTGACYTQTSPYSYSLNNPFQSPKQLAINAAGEVWIGNFMGGAYPSTGVYAGMTGLTAYGLPFACTDSTNSSFTFDSQGYFYLIAYGSLQKASFSSGMTYLSSAPADGGSSVSNEFNYGLDNNLVTVDRNGDIISTIGVSGDYPQFWAHGISSAQNLSSAAYATAPSGLGITYSADGTKLYVAAAGGSDFYLYTPGSTITFPYTSATLSGISASPLRIASDRNRMFAGASASGTSSTTTNNFGVSPYSTWFQVNPATGTGLTSTQFLGGLNSGSGVAVDGLNNYWSGTALPVSGSSTYAFTEISGNLSGGTLATPLSPSPTSGFTTAASCTASACATGGGFQRLNIRGPLNDIAIDQSGNVWATFKGSNSNQGVAELVGAAAPVVAPLVLGLQ